MQRPPGVGPVALEPPARGVDAERASPSSAASRRQPARRGRRAGAARPRPPRDADTGSVERLRRAPRHGRPELVDEPRALRELVGVGVRVGAVRTTRRARAPSTIRNRRRSSSSRRAVELGRGCGVRSSAARSNIGSGRDRHGKLPSVAPATSTVSNSRPTAAVRGEHLHRVVAPSSPAREPGAVLAASSDSRNASLDGSAAVAGSTRRRRETSTTASRSRRRVGGRSRPARPGRPRTGELVPQHAERVLHRHAGDGARPCRGARERLRRRPRPRVGEPSCSVERARDGAAPCARARRSRRPRRRRRQPDQRRRSASGSISSSRSLRVGDQPAQREHVRAGGGLRG